MGKVTLLFAGKSYDTDVQSVRENQIVIFDGPYNMRQRMVVAGIAHTQSGYNYRLIDPETAEEHSADLIRPLRDKFGIGHYYDDEHPEFMDAAEVAALRTRADALKAEQEAARRAAAEDAERLRTIGAERLRQIVPDDAVAVIIGEQHESECDPYTDYFGSRIVRTVILGFSTHTRDLFPEMRKAAARFEGTAHLAERNAEYEHREKYSMGHGYYLGTHRYSGWQGIVPRQRGHYQAFRRRGRKIRQCMHREPCTRADRRPRNRGRRTCRDRGILREVDRRIRRYETPA